MADYALPTLTSNYSDMLTVLKDRDINSMKMFDGTTDNNLPAGTKKWNSTNNYFEKFDGSSWSPLAAKYMINVDLLDGCTVNDTGTSSSDLWTASKVLSQINTKLDSTSYTANDVLTKLKTIDGIGSGLDADLLDGMNSSTGSTGNTIVSRDASGNFSAGTITANLSGNASNANQLNGFTSTSLSTGNSIVARDASGNFSAGTITANLSGNASNANTANSINNIGAGALVFTWSGQAGQPSWVFGSNDGANAYVYNPSNFKVAGFSSNATRLEYCRGAGSDSVMNLALGNGTLVANTTGTMNTSAGYYCLSNNTTGSWNTAVGTNALGGSTTGYNNTAVGSGVMKFLSTTTGNTGVGSRALFYNTGAYNTALGYLSMENTTTGSYNTALGFNSMATSTTGNFNTTVGYSTLRNITTGSDNACIGGGAGSGIITGTYNTVIGNHAMAANDRSWTTCIGAFADVTASNQNQIGSSGTTTFVYGTVQNRSDRRDKADIRDSELGLDFIMSLRPVDYKWDMREDYIDLSKKPVRPEPPTKPEEKDYEAIKLYNKELSKHVKDMERYEEALQEFRANNKLANIVSDGTKKRVRYHHGFIAQEVEELNADFGGLQNHKLKGGDDVMSLGYDEFIAPLVNAVQELQNKIVVLEKRINECR